MLSLINPEMMTRWEDLAAVRIRETGVVESFQESAMVDADGGFNLIGTDAVIPVVGPLSYKYDIWSWLFDGSSYTGIQRRLEAALNSNSVNRIVMLFDTPGGYVVGCSETAKMIAASSKPTVAVVDPECASAGLWLASQCDRIVCLESGEIGSLGVQAILTSYAAMLEKAGVDVKVVRAEISKDKNLGIPYEALTEKVTGYVQERVDKIGEEFLAAVAAGRGVSTTDALEKFGQGRMLFGDQALEAGLIDEIGTLQSVLSESVSTSAKPSNRVKRAHRRRV